jgi:hypothetical protein
MMPSLMDRPPPRYAGFDSFMPLFDDAVFLRVHHSYRGWPDVARLAAGGTRVLADTAPFHTLSL